MRNEHGQFIKGHTGNPLGRPKRADEQYLIDLWTEHGQKAFACAVEEGEQWAIKLLLDKLYANKKDVDARISVEPPKLSVIFDPVFSEIKSVN
jgi:hypothetical protein